MMGKMALKVAGACVALLVLAGCTAGKVEKGDRPSPYRVRDAGHSCLLMKSEWIDSYHPIGFRKARRRLCCSDLK